MCDIYYVVGLIALINLWIGTARIWSGHAMAFDFEFQKIINLI